MSTTAPAGAGPVPAGQSFEIDPESLVIASNPRKDLNLNEQFVKNIKQHGVIEPVIVHWDDDNQVYALTIGQRRRAGAIKAGVKLIPAFVTEKPTDDPTRAARQYSENVHRAAMSDSEESELFLELEGAGWSAMQIAAQTSSKLARVGDGLKVAKTPLAKKALAEFPITLEAAAQIASFDGDPAAVKKLIEAAPTSQFAHVIRDLESKREIENHVMELRSQLLTDTRFLNAGDLASEYSRPAGFEDVLKLEDIASEADPMVAMTVDELAGKPGAAAAIARGYFHKPDGSGWRQWAEVKYFAVNATENGFKTRGQLPRVPATPEEIEERRIRDEEAEARIQQKAALTTAAEVRREWIRTFLADKLPDSTLFVARSLAVIGWTFDPEEGPDDSVLDLLGIPIPTRDAGLYVGGETGNAAALAEWLEAHKSRAAAVSLAVIFTSLEYFLNNQYGYGSDEYSISGYLTQLSEWGYGLSAVEQSLVDDAIKNDRAAS